MDQWLRHTVGLNTDEAALIVAFLSLLVAVPAAVPPVRASVRRAAHRALLWSGKTRRGYARWFLAQHNKIQNIYLNRIEELDLSQTYVSLAFIVPQSTTERRVQATNVLADDDIKHILIIGDPGSGKSTLLTAYGVGILRRGSQPSRSDLKFIAQSKEIPVLVRLRQFAPHADGDASLAKYICKEILQRQARIRGSRDFLQGLLRDGRCLLLLDGLDEVPDNRYAAVRDAIAEFVADDNAALPTAEARVILSCRRQNFLRMQTDWIPTFCDRSYVLAPLRDADIFSFLLKRQRDFAAPRTIDSFFVSIKNSGTLDLHRVPLILTISLGLYLQLVAYEIPRSIAKFYEAMINELLVRHDFRGDSAGSTNSYNAEDKYRFLREFAFAMAQRPDRFEDFTFDEIISFADAMVPKMSYVQPREAGSFVREIIDRSGLLARISDEDQYIYAHRSIQEYLITIQLSRDPAEGARFLLQHSANSSWRQVALFFAALDHNCVQSFISDLTDVNLELAGYCLAAAGPVPDGLAERIVGKLAHAVLHTDSVAVNLSAIVSITSGQKGAVQDLAIRSLADVLTSILGRADLVSALGSDPESALRLLQALASTGSSQIAVTVPTMLGAVSLDDERVIGILWRCLAADGMELEESSKVIVNRLVTMVMRESGLAELQRQPAYAPSFATDELRRRVYPFRGGVDEKSNLVTLLTWAEHLAVQPDSPNRYLMAMRADPEAFASIERDRNRAHPFRPFYLARTVASVAPLAALAFVLVKLIPHVRLLEVRGSWVTSGILVLGPPVVAAVIAVTLGQIGGFSYRKSNRSGETPDPRFIYTLRVVSALNQESRREAANLVFFQIDDILVAMGGNDIFDFDVDFGANVALVGISMLITLVYSASVTLLAPKSMPTAWGVVIGTAVIWLLYWLPATRACARSAIIYLRRPNRYVDVYEDGRSMHWVTEQLHTGKPTPDKAARLTGPPVPPTQTTQPPPR